jgi:hypothetical protein
MHNGVTYNNGGRRYVPEGMHKDRADADCKGAAKARTDVSAIRAGTCTHKRALHGTVAHVGWLAKACSTAKVPHGSEAKTDAGCSPR